MPHAKLTKVQSNHDSLSKDVYEGETPSIPSVGSRFILYHGQGMNVRMLTTTEIMEIKALVPELIFRF